MKKNILNKRIKHYFKKNRIPELLHIFSRQSKKENDLDTSCFFATQAYILSLEINHPMSKELFIFLKKNNREY